MALCPGCGMELATIPAAEAAPPADEADVAIARIQAEHSERLALIERGIDPDRRRPLDGIETAADVAEIHADAEVAVAESEASAEVAAAEALGDAIEASAEVVGDALEATAEIVASEDDVNGELPDEIIVSDVTADEDAETSHSGSHARRWGF